MCAQAGLNLVAGGLEPDTNEEALSKGAQYYKLVQGDRVSNCLRSYNSRSKN